MNGALRVNGEATKQDAIVSALRSAVVSGDLEAGVRLPIRSKLETQFDASRMTVQKALDQLARDGYTRARGKLGTFITDYPPCLCRYGIVFSDKPQAPTWGGYHEALRLVGHELSHVPERTIAFYFGVNHEGDGDYDTLLADIQSQRLAGVLFAEGPWFTHRTPIVQQELVPCMAIMSPVTGTSMRHVATARFDGASCFDAAIGTLVEKGCRRPAILIGAGYDRHLPVLRAALAAHGLGYNPAMLQGVSLEHPRLAEHVMAVWMQLPEALRPDGIYIADDNLVEHGCSGLLHAGIHPGVDMPVAAHCNFPTRAGGPMPLDRLGFDLRVLAQTFIETTDARRRGEPFEMHALLTAVHESELESSVDEHEEFEVMQMA